MAWATPLVVLVLVVIAANLAGIGPFAPGASDNGPDPSNGPLSASSRVGDFELTIRSAKARYLVDEPIDVDASLAYAGQGIQRIGHGLGAGDSPLGFGIGETVMGNLELAPSWRQACKRSAIAADAPLTVAFEKSGAWSGDDPRSQEYRDFVLDPVLRLTAGTWHLYAVAEFSLGDCSADVVSMRADLTIDVVDGPADAPTAAPNASPVSDCWRSSVANDDLELSLEAAQCSYISSDPIDVVASLTYRGPDDSLIVGIGAHGPIVFAIDGLIPPVTVPLACTEVELERGVPLTERLEPLNTDHTPFRLPHGLRRIHASADLRLGGCGLPAEELATSIVVAVADDESDIPIWTQVNPSGVCPANRRSGRLVLDELNGLGIANAHGDTRGAVWPLGYSARREAGAAFLLDSDGRVVAQEGDQLVFSGGVDGDLIVTCGSIDVEEAPNPEPTATPVDRLRSTDRSGGFELRIDAPPTVRESEPVNAVVTLTNVAIDGAPHVLAQSPIVDLFVDEVGGDRHAEQQGDGCGFFGLYEKGEPNEIPFVLRANHGAIGAPDSFVDLVIEEPMRLPPGLWRLTARTRLFGDACDAPDAITLEVALTIRVDAPVPLPEGQPINTPS
jgi:hypothetical protein